MMGLFLTTAKFMHLAALKFEVFLILIGEKV